MLAKAVRNKEIMNAHNTEFVRAPITNISPLPSSSVDCIISNCVVNLIPEAEKQLAFNEMARLLHKRGPIAISDILLKKNLPSPQKQDLALYVGCIAGASKVEDYERYLHVAGFKGTSPCYRVFIWANKTLPDVLITDTQKDLNVYKNNVSGEATTPCCATPISNQHREYEIVAAAGEAALQATETDEVDYNEYAGAFAIYAVLAAS